MNQPIKTIAPCGLWVEVSDTFYSNSEPIIFAISNLYRYSQKHQAKKKKKGEQRNNGSFRDIVILIIAKIEMEEKET